MHFPWKKTKVSRFSRFVADLQSPKRGGSILVETGFPTSLVHLFFKSRDRFNKKYKKKPKSQLQHSHTEISNVIKTTPPLPSPPPSGFQNPENEMKRTEVQEFVVLKNYDSVIVDTTLDMRNIVLTILKMFLVVLLALSATRLAVGITMSAFLLLLLEYVGSCAFCFIKPCSISITMIESLLCKVKVLLPVRSKREKYMVSRRQEDSKKTPERDSYDNLRKSSSIQIQVVEESNTDRFEEIRKTDSVNGDDRKRCLDGEKKERVRDESGQRICDILTSEEKKTKGDKMKAKILDKLVPKKLLVSRASRAGRLRLPM